MKGDDDDMTLGRYRSHDTVSTSSESNQNKGKHPHPCIRYPRYRIALCLVFESTDYVVHLQLPGSEGPIRTVSFPRCQQKDGRPL
jgi:hypothetical protein